MIEHFLWQKALKTNSCASNCKLKYVSRVNILEIIKGDTFTRLANRPSKILEKSPIRF